MTIFTMVVRSKIDVDVMDAMNAGQVDPPGGSC